MSSNTFRFERSLVRFLEELQEHNNREWFARHKERYQAEVQTPALAFIEAMKPRLRKTISRHVTADAKKSGGSMMRVYRDTRFSRDKRPYKTNVGIQFRHAAGKDVHAPGLYLHIEPGNLFLGTGIWHPDRDVLTGIRAAIVARPKAWIKARDHIPFVDAGFALTGDSLKRAPAGIPVDHPLIVDLRRTDFIAIKKLRPQSLLAADFVDRVIEDYASAKPLMRFLCTSLDLPW